MKKKHGALRKGKNTSESESDSEGRPSVFTKQDFQQALRKVSRRVEKTPRAKT
jgi:hypothetical protein